MRGVDNDAAKIIADRLKSMLMLSSESSSTAKKGASTLWRATGRYKNDAKSALIDTIT